MKSKLGILSLFLVVCSSALAQFKFDIAGKVGFSDEERLQVEQRFHLKSPYSIVVAFSHGSRYISNYNTASYNDSMITTFSDYSSSNFNSLKFGVQRKIGGVGCTSFYAGLTLGAGYQIQNNSLIQETYFYTDSLPPNPVHYLGQTDVELISSSNTNDRYDFIHTRLGVAVGMDITLTKRLLINAEIASYGGISAYIGQPKSTFFNFQSNISVGMRFQFGKREEL